MTPSSRTLVIGDVHGCLRQLDALLDGITPGLQDQLMFLGDLIDRGPDSVRWSSHACSRRGARRTSQAGNHGETQ